MSFLSIESAVLLLATVIATRVLGRRALPGAVLLASSMFYVASAPGGVAWLALSILLAFAVGARLTTASQRISIWLLSLTILVILGALVFVKLPGHDFTAPLGISYFTFRLVAYLLDVYWGRCEPARSLTEFAAFVSFFPQVTSGPIDRWGHFLGQLDRYEYPSYEQMSSALRLILFGLFKKLVVANRLGGLVEPVLDSPGDFSAQFLVAAAYAFPIQLYADFSGLTDIARGASRLLGIEAPRNFDRPFLASSVQEFWTRWHMSLTFWLRDYLFKPLSATLRRQGRIGLAVAIGVNMLAIGLWHGLQWTFLAFGVINAIYMVAGAMRRRPRALQVAVARLGLRRWGNILLTFNLMTFAFVFFRAADLSAALEVLRGFPALFHLGLHSSQTVAPALGVTPRGVVAPVAVMAFVEFGVARGYWDRWFMRTRVGAVARWVAYYAVVLAIVFGGIFDNTKFIYARF